MLGPDATRARALDGPRFDVAAASTRRNRSGDALSTATPGKSSTRRTAPAFRVAGAGKRPDRLVRAAPRIAATGWSERCRLRTCIRARAPRRRDNRVRERRAKRRATDPTSRLRRDRRAPTRELVEPSRAGRPAPYPDCGARSASSASTWTHAHGRALPVPSTVGFQECPVEISHARRTACGPTPAPSRRRPAPRRSSPSRRIRAPADVRARGPSRRRCIPRHHPGMAAGRHRLGGERRQEWRTAASASPSTDAARTRRSTISTTVTVLCSARPATGSAVTNE